MHKKDVGVKESYRGPSLFPFNSNSNELTTTNLYSNKIGSELPHLISAVQFVS